MANILVHNTRGKDDLERASLAFVVANAALSSGQGATVLLTLEGVWLATQGYNATLHADGYAPLNEIMTSFLQNGGQLWVCGACMKPRQIGPEQLIAGATVVGAATAVEALVSGAQTLSF